jgi:hypothetical protein
MSFLGFDATGRQALGQVSNPSPAQANIIGDFNIWPPAPRPLNFAKDWIAFYDRTIVGPPAVLFPFTNFDPPAKPPHFARDWIAFSGDVYVETLPISSVFSQFTPPPRPCNFARDWIAFSGDYFVQTTTLSFFTSFSQPPIPPRLAKDWVAYCETGFTIVPVNLIGIDFMPFAPGRAAKLWTRYGQQPQWWTYEFKAPITPKADRHDYGWPVRSYHRPHPTVYEQEYYDAVNKRWVNEPAQEEEPAPVARVPNLLIPINRLIKPVPMPSLIMAPPHRPVPTLHVNPPPFRLATKEEMDSDDEMIIRMLLEE